MKFSSLHQITCPALVYQKATNLLVYLLVRGNHPVFSNSKSSEKIDRSLSRLSQNFYRNFQYCYDLAQIGDFKYLPSSTFIALRESYNSTLGLFLECRARIETTKFLRFSINEDLKKLDSSARKLVYDFLKMFMKTLKQRNGPQSPFFDINLKSFVRNFARAKFTAELPAHFRLGTISFKEIKEPKSQMTATQFSEHLNYLRNVKSSFTLANCPDSCCKKRFQGMIPEFSALVWSLSPPHLKNDLHRLGLIPKS